MKAFAKVALGAFGFAASTVAVTTPSSAQLPVGWCLNMPDDGTANPEEFGCNTGEPDPNPRDVGNYGNRASTDQTSNADLLSGAAEPQS